MNNLDMPAMAIWNQDMRIDEVAGGGFTKREQACLTMGVADTGCAELDAIIDQGNKQRLAGLAMQGMLAKGTYANNSASVVAESYADSLLQQLKGDV